ncbi:MAG: hypothetical protein COA81_12140, partial [Alphaproteobacteria bacterium]
RPDGAIQTTTKSQFYIKADEAIMKTQNKWDSNDDTPIGIVKASMLLRSVEDRDKPIGAGQGKEQWSSRTGFLMAAIGFSVGLGNIWRFPYIMGENGGAAFLIIYLACALLIALPLLVSELAIGRRGRGSPVASMLNVAAEPVPVPTGKPWAGWRWSAFSSL